MTANLTQPIPGVDDAQGDRTFVPTAIDTPSREMTGAEVERHVADIPVVDEWADVDSGDDPNVAKRAIPMLAMNRNMDGGMTRPDTGEVVREFDIILLSRQKVRGYYEVPWDKRDKSAPNQRPDCSSDDGLIPTARPDEPDWKPQSATCGTCPHSKWVDNHQECRESWLTWELLLEDDADNTVAGQLVRSRWGGITASTFGAYWASFDERIPKRPPMAYVTHVTLKATSTSNGDKLGAQFKRGELLPRAAMNPVIEIRKERMAEFKALVAADAAASAGDNDDTSGGPFDGGTIHAVDGDGAPF